jgi:hypothetical protein
MIFIFFLAKPKFLQKNFLSDLRFFYFAVKNDKTC